MALLHSDSMGWHEGEQKMHSLMQTAPFPENPTSPFLTPGAAYLLQTAPLVAFGTLDRDGNPWTTLWGGEPGFSRSLGSSVIGVKNLVDRQYDPVMQTLLGEQQDGEVVQERSQNRVVSGLAIDLSARRRVKFSGHMQAGALGQLGAQPTAEQSEVAEMQLVVKVDSSLGNCPKYLNMKDIIAALPVPRMISDSLPLPEHALHILAKADLFFITSFADGSHMSTNNRGGPPGFVRVVSNTADNVTLAYPEYSGNRLYQTLGNLLVLPRAGCVFPDFDNGDVLYTTATTEILAGKEAAAVIPRSNLVVMLNIKKARTIERGLAFHGQLGEMSPYNPPVRYLASERQGTAAELDDGSRVLVKMLKREALTPTIARFRFSISDPTPYGPRKPGQYVALSFEDELSAGYSHMRDDDPRSLNDDYTRTFTVSSPPNSETLPGDEFEITIRNVGVVTNFMFRLNERAGLEVPLRGFGGEFVIEQRDDEIVPAVAGGIGITPLLGQLPYLDLSRLRLFWTINCQDIGLVVDTFARAPALAPSTTLFVSGTDLRNSGDDQLALSKVEAQCASLVRRRISEEDISQSAHLSGRWYICTGPALKINLLQWLAGKEIVYEDFGY